MPGLRKSFILFFFSFVFSLGKAQVFDVPDSVKMIDTVSTLRDTSVSVPTSGGKINANADSILYIPSPVVLTDTLKTDTLKKKWTFKVPLILYEGHVNGYNPKVAWQRSALIPGWGQIYDRRWWKPPIIWGGFIGLGVLIQFEAKEYGLRRAFHKCSINENCTPSQKLLDAGYDPNVSSENYLADRDYYRRNLELAVMGTVVWHLLNIIDAYVDAHLRDFNVTDDLSFKLKPDVQRIAFSSQPSLGMSFSFNIKPTKK